VLGYPVKASDARIGELWAIYGNFGNIFVMTTDGLFVAELFHDRRVLGLGSGPDYTLGPRDGSRGVSLAHLSLTEETFWTTWTQTPDQKVYLVAGQMIGIRFCPVSAARARGIVAGRAKSAGRKAKARMPSRSAATRRSSGSGPTTASSNPSPPSVRSESEPFSHPEHSHARHRYH
jgi:hypothetical protein